MISFYVGPYASYNSTTHADGIYFATDRKVNRLNGVDYVGPIDPTGVNFVKSITRKSQGVLTVTLGNGTTSDLTAVTLVNNLTTASAGQGALDAYQGKVLLDKINALGSVYQVKGTVADKKALLALVSASVGFVYNMTAGCTLNGKSYSAGTNFVCTTAFTAVSGNKETCWDALGGTMTGYATESYVQGVADSIDTNITAELAGYVKRTEAAIMREEDADGFLGHGVYPGAVTRHMTTATGSESSHVTWQVVECTPVTNSSGGTTTYEWLRIGINTPTGSSNRTARLVVQCCSKGDTGYPAESDWQDLNVHNQLDLQAAITKLAGIEAGANKYVLPTAANGVLGGVKTTSSVSSATGYTPCPIISGVPYYKDTNTTYTAMTAAEATAGTSTSPRLITPKVLVDRISEALSWNVVS